MAGVVVRGGQVIALKYLVNFTATPENLVLRLFSNNITPAETDTAGTYTESAGGGYGALTLTGASWTVTSATPSNAAYAQQVFTFTGALSTNPNVYGYYYTRASSADLVMSESFTLFTPSNNGDTIKITPQITATHT